jgi:DNA-binding beta-propeller fold protein YncE
VRAVFVLTLLGIAVTLLSQPAPKEQPGPLPQGGYLLNTGWRLEPAGRQVPLDTFPMRTALSADGKYLLVLNGGYNPPTISVLETASMTELSRTRVPDGWLGLTFSPDGKFLYVGGGAQASVFEFSFADGKLAAARTFEIVPAEKRTPKDFIGDVAVSPDGRLIYAAGLYRDAVFVINPQSGRVVETWPTGRRPYRILVHPDSQSYFVTSWADGTLLHHNAANGEKLASVAIGAHATDILWRPAAKEDREDDDLKQFAARIFVTAANTNNVYSVGVTDTKELRLIESINLSMTPMEPVGMTPTALALDPDQNRLFVVCSDANAVAVADVSDAVSTVVGFVPTGWYPTAVQSLQGGRLVVLNGRGVRSFPNPAGPSPLKAPIVPYSGIRSDEYVAKIQIGSLSVIDAFDEEALAAYTKRVLANSPYRDALLDHVPAPPESVIPARPGEPSPIKHVIYIVKENRTYDQMLGDLGKGNGDPSLALFGDKVVPNHRKLASEFVLLDNFYVNADVSADGHNWSTSAIANDYVQKMWPNSYGGRRKTYDYEGGEPAALPPAGYLWTNALQIGISIRNYGWWCSNGPRAATGQRQIASVRDPSLANLTNLDYRAFDLEYPDLERAKIFLADLAAFERSGEMPRLILLRLPNDHTSGTAPGKIAPLSAVADNDAAFGQIVEAVSRTRFWPSTAIFVLEDDAQNGADHVDSHRSPAFVLSPYTRRGIIDSTMYNTTSMLRTMELILGLRPMTHFDAAARPMFAAFGAQPDNRPYEAEKPRIPLEERNSAAAPQAARSSRLDFSEADLVEDDELNDILWAALRKEAAPAPVRSYFSRPGRKPVH